MEEIIQDEEIKEPAVAKEPANLPLIEEMMKAGLFIGRKSSKTHPRVKPFIFGARNGVSVIDLEETVKMLDAAMKFVKEKSSQKGVVLLVGTTPSAKKSVEEIAKKLNLPYVVERWLGGTLTNFKTLSKRTAYFKKLKIDKEAGRLDKYTKKERLGFDREIQKMSLMFSGLEGLQDVPAALFVADVATNMIAVREAHRLKIPVIGILSTDTNPEIVEYPILANDRSKSSVDWILQRFENAMNEGKNIAKETSN